MAETQLIPAVRIVDLGGATSIDTTKTIAQFEDWPGLPDGMVPVLALARFTIGGLGPTGSLTGVHDTVSPVSADQAAEPAGYTSSPWFYDPLADGGVGTDLSIPTAPGQHPSLIISDNVKLEDVEVRLLCIFAK